jgi:superfamily I DNA and/or RNA helicase
LNGADASKAKNPQILIITPYRKQERRLARLVSDEQTAGNFENIKVEVCTLDRCQGRESEYVFISLVRNRASAFLDAPKRWNVALTRAMEGLFIFGDIDSYLREAGAARRAGADTRPLSLLARLLDAYQRQNASGTTGTRNAR